MFVEVNILKKQSFLFDFHVGGAQQVTKAMVFIGFSVCEVTILKKQQFLLDCHVCGAQQLRKVGLY